MGLADQVSTAMITNVLNSTQAPVDLLRSVIQDWLIVTVGLCISLTGIVSNSFNIAIFWKLGLGDSMSVGLFALSCTDFLLTLSYAVICFCHLAHILYPSYPINFLALGYFAFGWEANIVYLTSCWITAVISVERCFCVVSPFRVKQVFTRLRCTMVILAIYFILTGAHLLIFIMHKMAWVDVPSRGSQSSSNNMTKLPTRRFTLTFNEYIIKVEIIFDIVVSLALSDLSLSIVTVCTIWMAYSLKTSSKIRLVAPSSSTSDSSSSKSSPKLSYRERKMVKVVMAIAITLVVCGLPRVIAITVYNSIPGVNVGSSPDLTAALMTVAWCSCTLGSAITIVGYLVLNSSYRDVFCQSLGCCYGDK